MNRYFLIICFFLTSAWAQESLPWVFFAKVDGRLIPLSGHSLGQRFGFVSMFAYGDSNEEPVEFTLEHGYAYTRQEPYWEYAGFQQDRFVFGVKIPATIIQLDRKNKLLNGPFYSCDLLAGVVRGIVHGERVKFANYCFQVEVYLLPYYRETKSAEPAVTDQKFGGDTFHNSEDIEMPLPGACSIYFHGDNVDEDVRQFLSMYTIDCDIYKNGDRV